jgi:hypothetical protein
MTGRFLYHKLVHKCFPLRVRDDDNAFVEVGNVLMTVQQAREFAACVEKAADVAEKAQKRKSSGRDILPQ